MAKTNLDYDVHYDITDKPRTIGKCALCECNIYETMEYYDFTDELVCIDCKDDYVNDRFYRI